MTESSWASPCVAEAVDTDKPHLAKLRALAI
jgi:hypothetical protein